MLLFQMIWLYFLDFDTCITFLVWQEAFQNGQGQLSKNAIVHVWKGEDWQNVTHKVIQIKYLKPRTFAFSSPNTVFLIILYTPIFLLEIRVIIKILSHPWYPLICDEFE